MASRPPGFSRLLELLPEPTARPGDKVGTLTAEAALTGLSEGIAVAAANIDAHATVPAANACEPGQLTLIMGTSTCHMMTSESFGEVPGIGGIVPDGIVKGLWGYEAGQAGVGDIFAWFVNNCVPGAAGVDRVRYPRHHRRVPRGRGCRRGPGHRGWAGEEPAAHADLCRCDGPAANTFERT